MPIVGVPDQGKAKGSGPAQGRKKQSQKRAELKLSLLFFSV
jgi:hypothetical protein